MNKDVFYGITQRVPFTSDDEREQELVNALWRHVENDKNATHIFISLISHYNTLIFRLRDIIDGLTEKTTS